MKKLAQLASISLIVVLLALSYNANAQDGSTFIIWEEYRISFFIPSDFAITQNDANGFTAVGTPFTLIIKPWKNASITDPMLIVEKVFFDLTPGTKQTYYEQPDEIREFEGLQSYAIFGSVIQNKKLMYMIISGFLNTNNDTSVMSILN